jgi:hypothetical protein
MYSFFQPVHSYLAYFLLTALISTVGYALYAAFTSESNPRVLQKLALISMIFSHIQLLIGLAVYGVSPYGFSNLSGAAMADATQRLLALEHPFTNILAILLITVGYRKVKKAVAGNTAKHVLIYYGIGLLLLMSRIPWGLWFQ